MIPLRQSTAIDIRMGPFSDVGDGFTPETGVTIGASDQAEVLKANGAATVAMAGVFAAVTDCDGWYDYTASAGDLDTVGEVVFVMQDLSVYLPVFMRFYVVEEAVYDALYAASAEGPLQGTTAGNTLDVNATGEAGLDLDNTSGTLTVADIPTLDADMTSRAATGAAMALTAAAVDDVWDEDIIAAHGTADTAGLLLRALGAVISQRTNNATLNALLGVADAAGEDVPSQVLDGDTMAELGDAVPAATPTFREFAMLLYHLTRDESTTTATLLTGKNDAGTAIFKQTLADDGTTMTRSEMVAQT